MSYDPRIHHRKSIRLKGYDYSQAGLYFLTICVQNRLCLFGDVVNGKMILNDAGRMVEREWLDLPQRFSCIKLHEFVVMPNHFHSIVEILGATLVVAPIKPVAPDEPVAPINPVVSNKSVPPNKPVIPNDESVQPQGIAPSINPKTVGDMVGAFKSIVTVEYIRGVKQNNWQPFHGKLWQRNYWEHIIRDERSHHRISEYILNNPAKWDNDKLCH